MWKRQVLKWICIKLVKETMKFMLRGRHSIGFDRAEVQIEMNSNKLKKTSKVWRWSMKNIVRKLDFRMSTTLNRFKSARKLWTRSMKQVTMKQIS